MEYYTNSYYGQLLATRVDDLTHFEITKSANWTTFNESSSNSSTITFSNTNGRYSSLSSTKMYRIDYTVSLNISSQSTDLSWTARIYSGDITGTILKEGQIGVHKDPAMPSITLSYIGTGNTQITPSLCLNSGTYSNTSLDCQVSFTIQEIR